MFLSKKTPVFPSTSQRRIDKFKILYFSFFILIFSAFSLFFPKKAWGAVSYNTYNETAIDYIYTDDGGSFSSNNSEETVFDYFSDDAAVNDAIYFGRLRLRFRNLKIYVSTQFAATSVTFTWEYWNGSSWSTLSNVTDDDAFIKSGEQTITFDMPKDWQQKQDANLGNAYSHFVRARISAIDTPTEGGAQSTQKVEAGDNVITVTGTETLASIYDDNVTGGWGVVEETEVHGNLTTYNFYASLYLGDGSTTTSMTETNKNLNFFGADFHVLGEATLTLGQISGSGNTSYTKNGCAVHIERGGGNPFKTYANSIANLYNTTIRIIRTPGLVASAILSGTVTLVDFNGDLDANNWSHVSPDITYIRCNFSNLLRFQTAVTTTPYRLKCYSQLNVFIYNGTVTYEQCEAPTLTVGTNILTVNAIDCVFDNIVFSQTPPQGPTVVYEQHRFDLKVVDDNNTGINGATVVIIDEQKTEVFNGTTDANGDITQQVLNETKHSKYSDGSTDSIDYSLHTITISKAGYETKTIKYDMDRKREEIALLKKVPTGYVTVPSGVGQVTVLGTEYESSESGAVCAQVLNQDGTPATSATVTLDLYKSNGAVAESSQSMDYLDNSNGIYCHELTVPATAGVYIADVVSSNPTAYGTGEVHISSWANKIATAAEIATSVWSKATSALTTSGSIGKLLVDNVNTTISGVAGSVWSKLTSGLTTASSIGKLLVDNINATISSRSSHGASSIWSELTSGMTTSGSIGELLAGKIDSLNTLASVNRQLLEKVANAPQIKVWYEKGSIILKAEIRNPSTTLTQTVEFKQKLPREVKPEHIVQLDGLEVKYDSTEETYYLYGEFRLFPQETIIKSVKIKNIWQIAETEIESLKNGANQAIGFLEKSPYFAQGSMLVNDINTRLDSILEKQEQAITPEEYITVYRENLADLEIAKKNFETLNGLVLAWEGEKKVVANIGGIQITATWGIILAVVVGLGLLGLTNLYLLKTRGKYLLPAKVFKAPFVNLGIFAKKTIKQIKKHFPFRLIVFVAFLTTLVSSSLLRIFGLF